MENPFIAPHEKIRNSTLSNTIPEHRMLVIAEPINDKKSNAFCSSERRRQLLSRSDGDFVI